LTFFSYHQLNAYENNSSGDRGGAIYLSQTGVSTIEGSTIQGNDSDEGGGIAVNEGVLWMENTAVYSNTATDRGGGFYSKDSTMHIINSTISGNDAGDGGDGIYNYSFSEVATAYLTHTTVINNDAQNIRNHTDGSPDTALLYLSNSIVAFGTSNDCRNSGSGTETISASYSLDTDGSCVTDGVDGNITDAALAIGSLQDNGGDSWTHELSYGSSAIDQIPSGTNGCDTTYTTDQRGEDRLNAAGCDMGAYERIYCTGSPYTVVDEQGFNEAVACYNLTGSGQTMIELAADITLLTDTISIDNSDTATLLIDGDGYMLDGNGVARPIAMERGSGTTIDSLTVINGYSSSHGGGIYVRRGTFTVTHSAVMSNTAVKKGGGIFVYLNHSLVVQDSEIAYNEAGTYGGGISFFQNNIGTIERSSIHHNQGNDGGGVYAAFGDDITIRDSTIYNNESTGERGGGVRNDNGILRLINSTLSGNEGSSADGIFTAAYDTPVATTYLTHTTVISNGNYSMQLYAQGASRTVNVYLFNSIVAGGTATNCVFGGGGTSVITATYSLDTDGTCVSAGVDGNITASDPQIEALQDNGGDTWTHALQSDSPALDQIPYGTNGCGTTYVTDQRGEERPFGTNCDMGAYEQNFCTGSPYIVSNETELNKGIYCYNWTFDKLN